MMQGTDTENLTIAGRAELLAVEECLKIENSSIEEKISRLPLLIELSESLDPRIKLSALLILHGLSQAAHIDYHFLLMAPEGTELEIGPIYLSQERGKIAYHLLNEEAGEIHGSTDISAPQPFTLESLAPLKDKILKEIAVKEKIPYIPADVLSPHLSFLIEHLGSPQESLWRPALTLLKKAAKEKGVSLIEAGVIPVLLQRLLKTVPLPLVLEEMLVETLETLTTHREALCPMYEGDAQGIVFLFKYSEVTGKRGELGRRALNNIIQFDRERFSKLPAAVTEASRLIHSVMGLVQQADARSAPEAAKAFVEALGKLAADPGSLDKIERLAEKANRMMAGIESGASSALDPGVVQFLKETSQATGIQLPDTGVPSFPLAECESAISMCCERLADPRTSPGLKGGYVLKLQELCETVLSAPRGWTSSIAALLDKMVTDATLSAWAECLNRREAPELQRAAASTLAKLASSPLLPAEILQKKGILSSLVKLFQAPQTALHTHATSALLAFAEKSKDTATMRPLLEDLLLKAWYEMSEDTSGKAAIKALCSTLKIEFKTPLSIAIGQLRQEMVALRGRLDELKRRWVAEPGKEGSAGEHPDLYTKALTAQLKALDKAKDLSTLEAIQQAVKGIESKLPLLAAQLQSNQVAYEAQRAEAVRQRRDAEGARLAAQKTAEASKQKEAAQLREAQAAAQWAEMRKELEAHRQTFSKTLSGLDKIAPQLDAFKTAWEAEGLWGMDVFPAPIAKELIEQLPSLRKSCESGLGNVTTWLSSTPSQSEAVQKFLNQLQPVLKTIEEFKTEWQRIKSTVVGVTQPASLVVDPATPAPVVDLVAPALVREEAGSAAAEKPPELPDRPKSLTALRAPRPPLASSTLRFVGLSPTGAMIFSPVPSAAMSLLKRFHGYSAKPRECTAAEVNEFYVRKFAVLQPLVNAATAEEEGERTLWAHIGPSLTPDHFKPGSNPFVLASDLINLYFFEYTGTPYTSGDRATDALDKIDLDRVADPNKPRTVRTLLHYHSMDISLEAKAMLVADLLQLLLSINRRKYAHFSELRNQLFHTAVIDQEKLRDAMAMVMEAVPDLLSLASPAAFASPALAFSAPLPRTHEEAMEMAARDSLASYTRDPAYEAYLAALRYAGFTPGAVPADGNCSYYAVYSQLQTHYGEHLAELGIPLDWDLASANHYLRALAASKLEEWYDKAEQDLRKERGEDEESRQRREGLENTLVRLRSAIARANTDQTFAEDEIFPALAEALEIGIVHISAPGEGAPYEQGWIPCQIEQPLSGKEKPILFIGHPPAHFEVLVGAPSPALQEWVRAKQVSSSVDNAAAGFVTARMEWQVGSEESALERRV